MGKFDLVLKRLYRYLAGTVWANDGEKESVQAAIRALEQYERYEKLIEAAGKVDKQQALHTIVDYSGGTWEQIRALFAAIPDAEEKSIEDEAYLRNMDEPGPKDKEA